MGLSRVSVECKMCPYLDTCEHKRMEAIGFLTLSIQQEAIDTFMNTVACGTNIPYNYLAGNKH